MCNFFNVCISFFKGRFKVFIVFIGNFWSFYYYYYFNCKEFYYYENYLYLICLTGIYIVYSRDYYDGDCSYKFDEVFRFGVVVFKKWLDSVRSKI